MTLTRRGIKSHVDLLGTLKNLSPCLFPNLLLSPGLDRLCPVPRDVVVVEGLAAAQTDRVAVRVHADKGKENSGRKF